MRARYIVFLILFTSFWISPSTYGEEKSKKKTICLNMIVKNEKDVICRCLESVMPVIDYWVIVDTGSTDGTQQIIKEYMKKVPGELHERPWKDFAFNRNEALQLAKGKADYVLIMDADDSLILPENYVLPDLDLDAYYVNIDFDGLRYARKQLVNMHIEWHWIGVLHEAITSSEQKTEGILPDVIYKINAGGARSKDPKKFHKDAEVLERAIKEEPDNSRYMFYLAQSYKCSEQYEKALEHYKKRAEMGGWDEEVYCALLQAALLQENLNYPENIVLEGYYKAYAYRPSRAESLYYLAHYYRKCNNYGAAYCVSRMALATPMPSDILFVEKTVYDYYIPFEFSLNAYWMGKYDEAWKVSQAILAAPSLPENVREAVNRNIMWIKAKAVKQ